MQRQTTMVYRETDSGGNDSFQGHSIKITLPPKPGYEGEDYNPNGRNDGSESRMDLCTLTLSCIAQDPHLPSSKLPFAWKLYEMLETVHMNKSDTDIVSWVDDGRAFKVHDLKRFVDDIVPTYFKQSKYKSFQRQLYFYGFTREASSGKKGHTTGSYRHPKFVRGNKSWCLSMTPKKSKKRSGGKNPRQEIQCNTETPGLKVVREVSQEGVGDNSLSSTSLPFPMHLPSHMNATAQTANVVSQDGGSNNKNRTPFQFENDFSSTDTIPAANGRQHRNNPRGVTPQLKFRQQQNNLQRLQMESFLRSLNQNNSPQESVAPLAPSLRPDRKSVV